MGVNRLGLRRRARSQPFYNLGGASVKEFLDLTVDGVPLLEVIEGAAGEHFDVVTAVTAEFPPGAVDFLAAMLGRDDRWSNDVGAEVGDVPIYVCPIDYDLLCGGIVATVTHTDDVVRRFNFRHISTDDAYNDRVTAALQQCDYCFDRVLYDDLLSQAEADFAERAGTWVRPDDQVSVVRRWIRRLRRRLGN